MGEIRPKVRLENAVDIALLRRGQIAREAVRVREIEAVADTGAVMNLLPQDLVEYLGLDIIDKRIVLLADDRKIELPVAGNIWLTVAGRSMTADCLVGPPGCEALLGQIIMENLDLIADPLKRTLTPRPESPNLATIKMKRSGGFSRGENLDQEVEGLGRGAFSDRLASAPQAQFVDGLARSGAREGDVDEPYGLRGTPPSRPRDARDRDPDGGSREVAGAAGHLSGAFR